MRRLSNSARCARIGAWAGLLLAGTPGGAVLAEGPQPDLTQILGLVRWTGVTVSCLVLIGAGFALRLLSEVFARLSARFTHRRLLFSKIESIVRFGAYLATGAIVIGLSFQINQAVLTLLGGTLAVAVGFALRDLVAAMIAGITIMFDRPFQVGDRVQYAGEYGDIVSIGLRSVRLQTLDDNTVTIPNNKILTDVTSSGNYGALDMQIQIDFYIGCDQDIALAETIVLEAMLTSQFVFLDKPVVCGLRQLLRDHFAAVHLRGRAYVFDTKYEKAFEADVTKRVLQDFRKHGIRTPGSGHGEAHSTHGGPTE